MKLSPLPGRVRLVLACAATLALLGPIAFLWWSSLLPDAYDAAHMGRVDYGGGPPSATGHAGSHAGHRHGAPVTVEALVTATTREADVRLELTARREGARYTLNGTTPGPVVRAVQGQLVEVVLHNDNIRDGTTLHWHGIDVPNAMDGVAGVTQDAVMPGESFTYRFVAEDAGTYWYHAHQLSHEQVKKGLLGAVVIEPQESTTATSHLALLHRYGAAPTLNGKEETGAVPAEAGEQVRVRVVNTDNTLTPVWVSGAPYRLLAVDGHDLNEPEEVDGKKVLVTAGARVDLGITVPPGGARVEFGRTTALVLGEDPTGGAGTRVPRETVDLLSYGEPTETGLDVSDPDREFDYAIGRRPGFLDGKPGLWWTINGKMFPDVPMFHVAEGDVAVMHITNGSGDSHPMHLHGHKVLVLSRNGEEATGSPWWTDSLEVGAGDSFDIAFVADNPGIWMDHCHNLPHAAQGLVAHLMYGGVESSFRIGGKAGNEPE